MPRILGVAACQGTWEIDTQKNLDKMEDFAKRVRYSWGDTVQLISFCELAVQGSGDPETEKRTAETIPGPATDRLCEIAKKYGYWVCNGSMMEIGGDGNYYNTSLLFSPQGEIAFKYRKTHPMTALEISTPGTEFPVFDMPGVGKIGIMICYDAHLPEMARALAYNGAELILWPTLLFQPCGSEEIRYTARCRAMENSCYVVGITATGLHGGLGPVGHSIVANPNGFVVAEAGDGETIMPWFMDLDDVSKARQFGPNLIPPSQLVLLKNLAHKYPQYEDKFADGAVYKDMEGGKMHFDD